MIRKLLISGLLLLGLFHTKLGYSQMMFPESKPDTSLYHLEEYIIKPPSVNTNFFSGVKKYNSLYIPIAFISYGIIGLENDGIKNINFATKKEVLEDHPYFQTGIDNYLQFTPAIATFALKFGGNQGEHGTWESARLYATSTLIMAGTVYALKSITHVQRPDESAHNSFPSGHTATAFAAAEFMHQEFKNSSPVLSYSGYLAASATGALRVYNNKHYLTDVITGAGIGILTTKAGYWLNKKLFKEKHKGIVN